MRDLEKEILELIRLTSTDLPRPVENRLRQALQTEEEGSPARMTLETILKNNVLARVKSTPLCQDTGTPIFFVHYPAGWSPREIKKQIDGAISEATRKNWLRPNAVEPLSGLNTGNNLGDEHFPEIYYDEVDGDALTIDLILKGGGCENVSAQYSLPDEALHACRDLDGVRRAALDAVWRAQGEGCAPGFLGVAIGGDRATSHQAAKEALLTSIEEQNSEPLLAELETRITSEANQLGIGPMGLGGKTTLLGTRVVTTHRLPASYFVSVAYMCWAFRHRKLTLSGGQVIYA
jgi:fumarate hydratase class I